MRQLKSMFVNLNCCSFSRSGKLNYTRKVWLISVFYFLLLSLSTVKGSLKEEDEFQGKKKSSKGNLKITKGYFPS